MTTNERFFVSHDNKRRKQQNKNEHQINIFLVTTTKCNNKYAKCILLVSYCYLSMCFTGYSSVWSQWRLGRTQHFSKKNFKTS